jgi:hypothetical protein
MAPPWLVGARSTAPKAWCTSGFSFCDVRD